MRTCTSCGNSVDEKAGLELTDGRFFCQANGCQNRFLVGVYENEVKPGLLRQNAGIILSMQSPTAKPQRREWWQFWKK